MKARTLKTILILLIAANISCQTRVINYQPLNKLNYKMSVEEKSFLDTLQYRTFKYFLDEINSENGLVKDRSTDSSPSSIAAVGFAVPIWAIGAEKGWITRAEAAKLTLNMLNFFWNSEQSTAKLASGYKGFYYHFLHMKTGQRFWNCELSSIDSGFLFCGMIFARNYFTEDIEAEKQIRDLATKLLARTDWKFWVRSANEKMPYQMTMGWDEKGFSPLGWFGYTEALFLYVIAAGMDLPNPEKAYASFLSTYQWREPYTKDYGHVVFPSLFAHQNSFLWLNPNGLADSYMKKKGIDYAENTRRATYVNREYAIVNPKKWVGYDSLSWGFSACDGPEGKYNQDGKIFFGYAPRGSSGLDSTEFDDGTIAAYAAGASIPFAPEICIPTLMNLQDRYGGAGVWGKHGFVDSFNPTVNWVDTASLGLDQGPIVLMIENYYNGFVWKYFMKDEIVQKGLKILGFEQMKK
ncbi:MAG: Tat pathway signal protein [Ignavibacteriales bacterium]|nr:Tat pathway signal protein [Ignavibacteriales bacterium]